MLIFAVPSLWGTSVRRCRLSNYTDPRVGERRPRDRTEWLVLCRVDGEQECFFNTLVYYRGDLSVVAAAIREAIAAESHRLR